MKKKLLALVVLSLLLFVTACSSGSNKEENAGGNSGESGSAITAWAWDPAFNIAALELAEKNYQETNADFDLNVIENAQPDIIQKLNTGLSSGTTKGMPNIVLIEDYRAQSFLQAYPDAFYPLDEYFNTDDFAKYKIAPTSFDGRQYGLPFDTGSTGLYVRTDYLEEAGFTVEDLTNIDWSEFVEIGKVIKEKTGKYLLTVDPNDLGTLRMMIQSAGSWYLAEDGITPDLAENEALTSAFVIYKEILETEIGKVTSDWSQFVGAFNSGEVAAVPTGNWITPSIKQEASQSGKWAVVPIPRLPIDGAVNASNLGGSSFYVLNVDGNEEAAKFLGETFGKNVDFYQDLVTEVGAIGTYLPASSGEAYQAGDEYFGGQTIYKNFTKWMDEIPSVNYGMNTYAIEDILKAEMQNYINGKALEDVLKDAQLQAEAQIK